MPYFAIFTTLGLTRLAEAQAAGEPLVFTHVAVGDGDGSPITPDEDMTELVNETARVTVNLVSIEPAEPNVVRVEGLFPSDVGGFTIREAGLFNGDNELIAVASYPPIYKPVLADGVIADEYIRILLEYEGAVLAVELSIDPNVIMATRSYVDDKDEQLENRIEYLEQVALHPNLGDGSDGAADLDGVNEYDWCPLAGSTYTVNRVPYLSSLIVRDGIILSAPNFPIHCTGTIETEETGVIQADGQVGEDGPGTSTAGQGGTASGTGPFLGGGSGGDGGSGAGAGAAGSAAGNLTNSLGGAGGAGAGTASAPDNAGGAGGTVTVPDDERGATRSLRAVLEGYLIGQNAGTATLTGIRGGAGGGGGGGIGTPVNRGGAGGGAGGEPLALACKRLVNNGTIRSNGGAGGGGTVVNAGGGGGGGRVGVVAGSIEGDGTIEATGGAAGTSPGGADGTAGDDGEVVLLVAAELPTMPHKESGKAMFSAADSVDITFPNGWAYANATGLDGYKLKIHNPFVTDEAGYGGLNVWVSEKSTTGFVIRAADVFTGEVEWEAEGF